jgi:HlyD family secretion protein
MSGDKNLRAVRRSIRLHLLAGVAVALLAGAGAAGWATTTEIAGAVIAPGVLVVESNLKKVQHLSGGVVAELFVREGDRVEEGDLLVRLDDTQLRAAVSILTKDLNQNMAVRARLEAERDGAPRLTFPEALLAQAGDADAAAAMAAATRLFDSRRTARNGQRAQLRERIEQMRVQVRGLGGQVSAKEKEIELITRDLETYRTLRRENLVPVTVLTAMERDAVRLEGERNQIIEATAQVQGRIAETELQILQIDQDLRSEVGRELTGVQARVVELSERKTAAEDQLRRVEIRAPFSGRVFELVAHTVGGVVTAGSTIMQIVPNDDVLNVEVQVNPQDIDKVQLGQAVVLRYSAFNLQTTPEINGQVSLISPDLKKDARAGTSYYGVRVFVPPSELARLGDLKLVPGMPVDAFLQTGERTALSYLIKPLRDLSRTTFREE